jgi:hypothetical protein
MPISNSVGPSSLPLAGRPGKHTWARPLIAPWSVMRTFSALAVLLAIAVTALVTSRVVQLMSSIVFDEASTG